MRGFILHPTYRIERRRAVVHLWGRLESGETFLVRDDREAPHFFVRAADRELAHRLGARPLAETSKRTLRGEPVVRVEVQTPPDTPTLRDRLVRAGLPVYEADVRYAMRYLIDRGIKGALEVEGEFRPGPRVERIYTNPELRPARFTPQLGVLSVDIETDAGGRLLAISLYGCGAAEVLLLDPAGRPAPPTAASFTSEGELLRAFLRRVERLDPDVLTGWNVIEFDLRILERRAARWGLSLELGRGGGAARVEPASAWSGARATVAGRVVLDGPQLIRGAFIRMEEHSLDHVARRVLGEGKLFRGPERVEAIWDSYRRDLPRFVEYSLTDARLVLGILERLELIELAVERSLLTGLPIDRVSASVAAFDFLYLSELGKRDRVAPVVGAGEAPAEADFGGHVLSPEPGLYRNVLVLDFKSLYPSLICTFQIDPLGYLPEPSAEADPLLAPNGAAFRRREGILTQLLDPLFKKRAGARRAGNRVAAQAIKILMNSFYGVLGTSASRFFNPQLASAITSFGKRVLLWSKAWIEERGHRVLYGDTDSLFVEVGAQDPQAARRLGLELRSELNRSLRAWIEQEWRVESRLEVEFERLYLRLLLPPLRHGSGGAAKRYAGLVEEGGRRRVVFIGLEVVRRDWTELARRVQRELYERLFTERPVEEYLQGVVEELRAGGFDEQLVYRKVLRKPLEDYTETTPPHVAAARKRSGPPRRRIAYVITTAGPEPVEEQRSPLDYQHYVDKQLRPVAEPVLRVLDLDFAEVSGDHQQLRLF